MPGLWHTRRPQIRLGDSLPQSRLPVLQSQLCAQRFFASAATTDTTTGTTSTGSSFGMEFRSRFYTIIFGASTIRFRSGWLGHDSIPQFSRSKQDLLCRAQLSPSREKSHQGHRCAQESANFALTRSHPEFARGRTADAAARGSWAGMAKQKRAASPELPQEARNYLASV